MARPRRGKESAFPTSNLILLCNDILQVLAADITPILQNKVLNVLPPSDAGRKQKN